MKSKPVAIVAASFFLVLLYTALPTSRDIIQVPNTVKEFDENVMSRAELGQHGWSLLHAMAAYFPAEPTSAQLGHAQSFLYYFAELFPCRVCGRHFEMMLKEIPPNFTTRDEFVLYLCKLHNNVNARIEKPIFDCQLETLNLKWGGGDCGCDD
mmetsp:Transcript_24102/g.42792  ORF Transcript_24102/g.42792 Transcript_24102/m.42792 type:complete len:153 (+) Transcript_24102:3066-3524(+)